MGKPPQLSSTEGTRRTFVTILWLCQLCGLPLVAWRSFMKSSVRFPGHLSEPVCFFTLEAMSPCSEKISQGAFSHWEIS